MSPGCWTIPAASRAGQGWDRGAHRGVAALQQGLGVAQEQAVVRVHDIRLAFGQRGCLRLGVLGVLLLRAIESLLGALLQQGLLPAGGTPRALLNSTPPFTPPSRRLSGHPKVPGAPQGSHTHVLVGAEELGPCVAGQHVDDDHLPPLLHINEQVAELAVVLVDEVDALRADLLKCHHHAAGHQLGRESPG